MPTSIFSAVSEVILSLKGLPTQFLDYYVLLAKLEFFRDIALRITACVSALMILMVLCYVLQKLFKVYNEETKFSETGYLSRWRDQLEIGSGGRLDEREAADTVRAVSLIIREHLQRKAKIRENADESQNR